MVTQATNPNRDVKKQNSHINCLAYLLIFFCGPARRVAKFTYAIFPWTVSSFEGDRTSCTISVNSILSATQTACSVSASYLSNAQRFSEPLQDRKAIHTCKLAKHLRKSRSAARDIWNQKLKNWHSSVSSKIPQSARQHLLLSEDTVSEITSMNSLRRNRDIQSFHKYQTDCTG